MFYKNSTYLQQPHVPEPILGISNLGSFRNQAINIQGRIVLNFCFIYNMVLILQREDLKVDQPKPCNHLYLLNLSYGYGNNQKRDPQNKLLLLKSSGQISKVEFLTKLPPLSQSTVFASTSKIKATIATTNTNTVTSEIKFFHPLPPL